MFLTPTIMPAAKCIHESAGKFEKEILFQSRSATAEELSKSTTLKVIELCMNIAAGSVLPRTEVSDRTGTSPRSLHYVVMSLHGCALLQNSACH